MAGFTTTPPVLVTDEVLARLKTLIPLVPLHRPHGLAGIEAAREAWPHLQQVACTERVTQQHQEAPNHSRLMAWRLPLPSVRHRRP